MTNTSVGSPLTDGLLQTHASAGDQPRPQEPPIDLVHLAKYTCGDSELERDVLRLFVDQLPNLLSQLNAQATDKTWRDAVHTLKGSARAVGARKLGDIAETAETAPPIHRVAAIQAMTNEVSRVSRYVEIIVS